MNRLLIVPAAGAGTRLGLSLPKLLVSVNGRAMIDHVLALYAGVVSRVAIIVHPSVQQAVRAHLSSPPMPVEVRVQPSPTGMLDAILLAAPSVERAQPTRVWITWCDQIAILPRTVEALRDTDEADPDLPLALATCRTAEPYVHLERDANGRITAVRHRREGDAMPEVGESDAGLFDLSKESYLRALPVYAGNPQIGRRTGERNFVPFVAWMAARGRVATIPCTLPEEAVGINTPAELERIAAHLRGRARTS